MDGERERIQKYSQFGLIQSLCGLDKCVNRSAEISQNTLQLIKKLSCTVHYRYSSDSRLSMDTYIRGKVGP